MAPFSPENIDEIMAQESALSMAQMMVNFPFIKSQDYSASVIAFRLQMREGHFPEFFDCNLHSLNVAFETDYFRQTISCWFPNVEFFRAGNDNKYHIRSTLDSTLSHSYDLDLIKRLILYLKDSILHGFRASNYFSNRSYPSDLYLSNFTAQRPLSGTQVEQFFETRSSQEPYRYNNSIL
jgi:hypothetical protein